MDRVGTVESLWRYPVKSMRGERLESAFAGYPGIYGDRIYAFHDDGAPIGFPFLTARERQAMLLYQPSFRDGVRSSKPENLDAASTSDLSPLPAETAELMVDVRTPEGRTYAIDDPALVALLAEGLGERHRLRLMRSQRAMVDCRPVSLFATGTAEMLGQEMGTRLDQRRFRANVYLDLGDGSGFSEDAFVGRTLRIGDKVTMTVLERDARCKMITLDPETADANPEVIKQVARGHEGKAGIYAAVLVEGMIRPGDEVSLLN